jgi:glycosyltransferase involved in cell wall biosynthesis
VGSGNTEYNCTLKETAVKLGLTDIVIWAENYSDMSEFYNGVDLLISSSLGEDSPDVVGESMDCGTMVIGSDVGDTAVIIDNPNIMCPPNDTEALKQLILRGVGLRETIMPEEVRSKIQKLNVSALFERTSSILFP